MHADAFPRALYRTQQVRAIEQAATAGGIAAATLMERAATATWRLLQRRWPQARRINVLAGPGDNGGDGLWLAALARRAGRSVSVCELAPAAARSAAAAQACALAQQAGVVLSDAPDSLPDADLHIDALFGIGLSRAPQGLAAQWIAALNAQRAPVLALDVPSGLDADTGAATDAAVRATVTLSFVAWKRGLFTGRARALCGEPVLDPLDLAPAGMPVPDAWLLDPPRLPPRARDAHKGMFGHVLVIGGSQGFAGAARLAGEAALRCGAGLVSVATRASHAAAVAAQRPELMAHAVESVDQLAPLLARASVLAVGPGLGQGTWGASMLDAALAGGTRLVLDADALNLLARAPRPLPPGCVLTPHPGEAARLLACGAEAVEADRFAAVRRLAQAHGGTVVLKGAGTLVAAPDGNVEVCTGGNPGMASGGMGDVLTGTIAALRAQGLQAWDAARLGVWLHARAGDAAAADGERGLLAGDLLPHLRRLCNEHA